MKQAARQIAISALIIVFLCCAGRLLTGNTYTIHQTLPYHGGAVYRVEELTIFPEKAGTVHVDGAVLEGNRLAIRVSPDQPGDAWILVNDLSGETLSVQKLYVGQLMTIYDANTSGFTADTVVLVSVALFWLLTCLIMIWHVRKARGYRFYHHTSIYFSGFSLFAMVNFLLMLYTSISYMLFPFDYSMSSAFNLINGAAVQFMVLTTPMIVLFAVAMSISNLALIRHEGYRVQNALGLLISFLLLAGTAFGWYISSMDFSGSEMEWRLNSTFVNVYATAFVYCECMLAGAVYCGIRAARYLPEMNQDFIVILGCWFRKDGSLPPLLRGRVDRALAFWQKQKLETGKEAVFIPSGGQGADECMPEAEAMQRYLLDAGIPEEKIIPEAKSRSTKENMSFSKSIIDSFCKEGHTMFVTTNYHVFRSGILASEAGLHATGIGSRTKWWFWPNAFMRECAGLLAKRWKQELLLLLFMTACYGMMSMLL